MHDISASKRMEKGLRDQAKALALANEELDGFSYSVSHELRASLRAIDGFSRILLEDYGERMDAEKKRLLDLMRLNAVRMAQLIDALLHFSRFGRQGLHLVRVDMRALVADVLEELLSSVDERVIEVDVQPDLLGAVGTERCSRKCGGSSSEMP